MEIANHIILLVEDDPDDVLLIMEALKSNLASLHIVHKKNGLEAINYLKEITNTSLPSLIIMDINMPVLNGKQMLSILKNDKKFQLIPVIVFTTSSHDGDKEFCNQFQVSMVTKPNNLESFNKKIQEFIKEFI